MTRKPYKRHKRGTERHVQLPEWVQASEVWATMKPGPRALYIELKRRFNGSNNGEIFLSYRDAACTLNVHRNTLGAWFDKLQERGFITTPPHLGPSGIGQASKWALEEMPAQNGKPAGKAFMRWREKQKPRTKNRTSRHNGCDAEPEINAHEAATVLNFVTPSAKIRKRAARVRHQAAMDNA